jgi:putative acetyltransferase
VNALGNLESGWRERQVIIRGEREDEFAKIHDLVRMAFQTAKVSDGREQDFVDGHRVGDNYLPELALVAEEDGRLIGHIMLTKTYITSGGQEHEALLLAPLSVVLEQRNRGVGTQLVNESLRLAKAMGYGAVFLVGDPAYYRRFGFRPTADFGIRDTHDGLPEEYVMVCELADHALAGLSGTIYLE